MAIRISTNIQSINAQNSLDKTQRAMTTSMAQLSSGSRITKAADDAAGLALSESLKGQISGYTVAQRNALDGQSMIQVAEGGINEVSNILVRLRELAVQSASDSVGNRERGFLDKEVKQLKLEVDRIAESTRFGTTNLLNGTGEVFDYQVDIGNDDFKDRISFDASKIDIRMSQLDLEDLDFSEKEGARDALVKLEEAQYIVNGQRSELGALQNRLISTQENLGNAIENISAANSRIRDTDVASATSDLMKNRVLQSASQAVLIQANNDPSVALNLIG